MSALNTILLFLNSIFFGFIILSLWLRIALRYFKISALNPFAQLIYRLTNPFIAPINQALKWKIPANYPYDWASFGILIVVEFLKILSISLILFHKLMPLQFHLLYVMADLVIQPCDILFYALLIRVIMSFVNPSWHHPMAGFIVLITEPLLKIGRRIVPDISGFDFSSFIMMIILKVISLAISNSLPLRLL